MKVNGKIVETPQYMFMRTALGIHLRPPRVRDTSPPSAPSAVAASFFSETSGQTRQRQADAPDAPDDEGEKEEGAISPSPSAAGASAVH